MTLRQARVALAILASTVLVGGGALMGERRAKATDSRADCACAGQPIVDGTLIAFLSKARAAHHRADLTQEDGDYDLAIAALEDLVKAPRPAAPEAAEIVADTFARLADLKSDLGSHEAALRDVEAGLALAPKPTHFRGHLLEVKGLVLERRYRALEATGQITEAAAMKALALDAFKAAIDVQEQVIEAALADGKR